MTQQQQPIKIVVPEVSFGRQEDAQGSVILWSEERFKIEVGTVSSKDRLWPSLGVIFTYDYPVVEPFHRLDYLPTNKDEIGLATEAKNTDASVEIPEAIWPEISEKTAKEVAEEWQPIYAELQKSCNLPGIQFKRAIPDNISIVEGDEKVTLMFNFLPSSVSGDFHHLLQLPETTEDTSDWSQEDLEDLKKTQEMVEYIQDKVPADEFGRIEALDEYLRAFSKAIS